MARRWTTCLVLGALLAIGMWMLLDDGASGGSGTLPREADIEDAAVAPMLRGEETPEAPKSEPTKTESAVTLDWPGVVTEEEAPKGLLIVRGKVTRDVEAAWPEGSHVMLLPVGGAGWVQHHNQPKSYEAPLDAAGRFEVDISAWATGAPLAKFIRARGRIEGFTGQHVDVDVRTAIDTERGRVLTIDLSVVRAIVIRGRLVDERGQVVPESSYVGAMPWKEGAEHPTKRLRPWDNDLPHQVRTPVGGAFELIVPSAGRYWLLMGTGARVPVARDIEVTAAGLDLGDVPLAAGHTLRGRVTVNGAPLANASLWLQHADAQMYIDVRTLRVRRTDAGILPGPASLTTDAEGRFEASARPEGPHILRLMGARELLMGLPQELRQVAVPAVPTAREVHLDLSGCVLEVSVEFPQGVSRATPVFLSWGRHARTGINWRDAPRKILCASGARLTLRLEGSGIETVEQVVEIPSHARTHEVELALRVRALGELQVRLPEGQAAAGIAGIDLRPRTQEGLAPPISELGEFLSPKAGFRRWPAIPPGRYQLTVHPGEDGHDVSTLWLPFTTEVTVVAGEATEVVAEFAQGGRVRIEAVDREGRPVACQAQLLDADEERVPGVRFQTAQEGMLLSSAGAIGTGLVFIQPALPAATYTLVLTRGEVVVRKAVLVRAGEVTTVKATFAN